MKEDLENYIMKSIDNIVNIKSFYFCPEDNEKNEDDFDLINDISMTEIINYNSKFILLENPYSEDIIKNIDFIAFLKNTTNKYLLVKGYFTAGTILNDTIYK